MESNAGFRLKCLFESQRSGTGNKEEVEVWTGAENYLGEVNFSDKITVPESQKRRCIRKEATRGDWKDCSVVRASVALADDLGLAPSTDTVAHNHL